MPFSPVINNSKKAFTNQLSKMLMNDYPKYPEKSNRRHFSFCGASFGKVLYKNGKVNGFDEKKLIRTILLYAYPDLQYNTVPKGRVEK